MDLERCLQRRPWRDDGLLPRAGSAAHYAVERRRPLTGLEELRCCGFQPGQLDLGGLWDGALRRLAAAGQPPPCIGASLCAMLAVVDLRPGGRDLWMAIDRREALLAEAPSAPAPFSVADLCCGSAEPDAHPEGRPDPIASRAASLLNLLAHSSMAERGSKCAVPPADVRSLLGKATAGGGGGARAGRPPEAVAAEKPPDASGPRDWVKRLRMLRTWHRPRESAITAADAMRWVQEAAEHDEADNAGDIVSAGLEYLVYCLDPTRVPRQWQENSRHLCKSLEGVAMLLDGLLRALRATHLLEGLGPRLNLLQKLAPEEDLLSLLRSLASEAIFIRGLRVRSVDLASLAGEPLRALQHCNCNQISVY